MFSLSGRLSRDVSASRCCISERECSTLSDMTLGMIVPEDIDDAAAYSGAFAYARGHWNYRRRCADVELAMTSARERVKEWNRQQDAHGWWHERPDWIALHNEVIRLRAQRQAALDLCDTTSGCVDMNQLRAALGATS